MSNPTPTPYSKISRRRHVNKQKRQKRKVQKLVEGESLFLISESARTKVATNQITRQEKKQDEQQ
jgi:hypothetical protein